MGEVAMFDFRWPWMIVLLALPLLVRELMSAGKAEDEGAAEVTFPYLARLQAAFPGGPQGPRADKTLLAALALLWFSLTGALMQPELVDSFTQVSSKGYDLMLAVDLSGSMRALDFTTNPLHEVNRLDVIKTVVSKFVEDRQGDRIGLILFGEKAYLHVPLTLDALSVRKMLDNAQVGEAGDSTAIGDALGLAVRNLRDRPENSRIVVLLTDGGDNASTIPPLEAAALAKSYGIRIYTVGIGTQGPVPIRDEHGHMMLAEMPLDAELLKKIAAATGGEYYFATDTDTLQNIYDRINALEKSVAENRSYAIRTPLYRYPLAFAMLLLLLLPLLPAMRRLQHGL
jgi:Ca-activated chloride channel family protein